MKKYLFCLLGTCFIGVANGAENFTVMGQVCEQVAVASDNSGEVIVRCPASAELLQKRDGVANSMFLSIAPSDEMLQDTENIYVNIVPNECGPDTIGYRVLVKNPVIDGEQMYANGFCE